MSKFVAQGNAGFQMTFDNGYTVSVRWQPGTYTEHNDWSTRKNEFSDWWNTPVNEHNLRDGWVSRTAEVAVIRRDKEDRAKDVWYNPLTLKKGDPEGWLSTDQVADIIHNVQAISIGVKQKVLNTL